MKHRLPKSKAPKTPDVETTNGQPFLPGESTSFKDDAAKKEKASSTATVEKPPAHEKSSEKSTPAKSDAVADSKSEPKTEAKSDSKSESKTDSKSDTKPESKSGKSDVVPEPKSDSKPEPKPEPKSEPKIETNHTAPEISVYETKPLATPLADSAPYLIQTRGLVKQYGGRRVVNGVDIHVRAGEVVGLLGKNGAGKTTTFYMIVGLVTPNEGTVFMGDEDVTHMPMYRRARRGIGYLPQEESIFRKLTVEENLLAILETLPMTEDERDARCDELLRDFGLEHVRENVAITLSGGEKRRVTIARALVTSPSLLLLDEPFAGVDPMAVHDIQEIIEKLKNKGMGILLTDHSVRETLSSVDRAYIINDGLVLSEGTREFILNDPIAREIYLGHRFSM